jgi:chromosomal replication initiator protein
VNSDVDQIWSQIKAEIRAAIDEPTYKSWLEPLEVLDASLEKLTLAAPAHSVCWIRDRFGALLAESASRVLGPNAILEIRDNSHKTVGMPTVNSRGGSSHSHGDGNDSHHHSQSLTPHPKLTFDQFVIGDSNRLAHAAALSVAEMPGHAYNPLFICGPPGVGKTHLLHSIAGFIMAHNPGLTVRNTTSEAFTNGFVSAVNSNRVETFKDRFRCVDVLLVDDVQFLERKVRTEEEFFHTFNVLHEAGGQIVLSSDRPPRDLQALEDRLRERFQAGLVADIQPPDSSTRLAILRKRAHLDAIELPGGGVLELIAERVTNDVRALEGALIRVVAYSSLTGRELNAELALDVLNGLYPSTQAQDSSALSCTLADIQAATCRHFELSTKDLLSANRTNRVALPRQLAMYLARELTDHSLTTIGNRFGGRDHSTVLHAHKRASERIANDDTCRRAVEKIREQLTQPVATEAPGRLRNNVFTAASTS